LWIRKCDLERVLIGRDSGGSNTPHWIRNNILDFLRAMSVKIAVKNGKICNKTTMGERL